jgi:hypothetical protein
MRFKLSFDGDDDVIKYFFITRHHTPVDPRSQSLSLLKSFLLAASGSKIAPSINVCNSILCDAHHTSIFS